MSRTAIRWLLLPFATVLAMVLAVLCGERFAIVLGFWSRPVVGFCAAFAAVSIVYIVAPVRKLFSASIAYLVGATLAYSALKDSYDPRTYEPTLMPFWVTLAGGALALAIMAGDAFGRAQPPPNKSLERTRER